MNDVDVDAVVDELIEELLGSLFTLHEHQYGRCDALQKNKYIVVVKASVSAYTTVCVCTKINNFLNDVANSDELSPLRADKE